MNHSTLRRQRDRWMHAAFLGWMAFFIAATAHVVAHHR